MNIDYVNAKRKRERNFIKHSSWLNYSHLAEEI